MFMSGTAFCLQIVYVLETIMSILSAIRQEEYKERFPLTGDTICRSLANGHMQKIFNLVLHG